MDYEFDFDDKYYDLERNIKILDNKLTDEIIHENIILISNIEVHEILFWMKEKKIEKVFIFEGNEDLSLFKEMLLKSQGWMDTGFNLSDIFYYLSSDVEHIKIIKALTGMESIKREKNTVSFINEEWIQNAKFVELVQRGNIALFITTDNNINDMVSFYIID